MSEQDANNTSNNEEKKNDSLSPEEVYNFFKEMPTEHLEKLAKDALAALDDADDREEAEEAVVKMAPFFLDCTFHRLPESMKAQLRKCLDDAEEKYGSLASVLGLDQVDPEELEDSEDK